MVDSISIPVIAGLAIGISLILIFSMVGTSSSSSSGVDAEQIRISISDLNDVYDVGEPISFTVHTKGISDNLCNNPKLHVQIIRSEDGKGVWYTPPTAVLALQCNSLESIDREWRFGYAGEELPYQSALAHDKYYENNMAIEKASLYKMVAEFDNHVAEKEFQVIFK